MLGQPSWPGFPQWPRTGGPLLCNGSPWAGIHILPFSWVRSPGTVQLGPLPRGLQGGHQDVGQIAFLSEVQSHLPSFGSCWKNSVLSGCRTKVPLSLLTGHPRLPEAALTQHGSLVLHGQQESVSPSCLPWDLREPWNDIHHHRDV